MINDDFIHKTGSATPETWADDQTSLKNGFVVDVFQRVFNQAKLQIFPIFLFLQQLSSLSSFKRKISEAQFAKEAEMES